MNGDVLAILDGNIVRVYAVNGSGAHELATAKVDDTAPDALASLVHGLKPFLASPPKPLPALMPAALPTKAAPVRAIPRKRATGERRTANEVLALVLSHVRQHPGANAQDMSRALGYTSDASVGRALVRATQEGLVVRQSTSAVAEGPGAIFQYWVAQ